MSTIRPENKKAELRRSLRNRAPFPAPPAAEKKPEGASGGEILAVRMLGDFSLSLGDTVLSGRQLHGKQISNLLAFLLANRNRDVTLESISRNLWEKTDREIDDPAGALKNLAYRLRKILGDQLGEPYRQAVISRNGAYIWNPAVPCRIDAEEVDAAYRKLRRKNISRPAAKAYAAEIIRRYRGGFLPHAAHKEWVMPLAAHYRRVFMEAAAKYCGALLSEGAFQEAELLARKAIAEDPFTEENHILLIRTLLCAGHCDAAMSHYEEVRRLYRSELGVLPSEALSALYEEILEKAGEYKAGLAVIKEELREQPRSPGAISCSYEMFKILYRIQARSVLRAGKPAFLVLLTVRGRSGGPVSGSRQIQLLKTLRQEIPGLLRKDDIVTQPGKSQFLLMLSNLNREGCRLVAEKISGKIKDGMLEVHIQIQPVDPVELDETDEEL